MHSTLHRMALLEIGLPKSIAKALRLPTNSPKRQQLRVLKALLKKAKYTQFGQRYGFESILNQRDPRRQFRELVPAH
ncbi:MAG: GH3 auxin-responsive promoter family protein, partial [Chitinophagaceae bacterium]|nr:GH3 auxin-responsive promoter family protein [Chitinophagaceae bacterium]